MTLVDESSVPYVNTAQMIEVDRAMMEDYAIGLIQMMENAGCNLARLARSRFLAANAAGKRVAVMAGPGGNGGGALVAARHLDNWGADVRVYLSRADKSMAPIPRCQLDILRRIGLPLITAGRQRLDRRTILGRYRRAAGSLCRSPLGFKIGPLLAEEEIVRLW